MAKFLAGQSVVLSPGTQSGGLPSGIVYDPGSPGLYVVGQPVAGTGGNVPGSPVKLGPSVVNKVVGANVVGAGVVGGVVVGTTVVGTTVVGGATVVGAAVGGLVVGALVVSNGGASLRTSNTT